MLSQLSMKVVQTLSNLPALELRITSLHKHPDSVSIAALEEAIATEDANHVASTARSSFTVSHNQTIFICGVVCPVVTTTPVSTPHGPMNEVEDVQPLQMVVCSIGLHVAEV
jgi:hypothetical protein